MGNKISIAYWVAFWLLPFVNIASARDVKIVVDTTADNRNAGDGSCTLREAIDNANANRDTTNGDCQPGYPLPTIDAIAFNLPSGEPTIMPRSALPTIVESVTIDGTTQSGFAYAFTHSLTCPNPTGNKPPLQTITISRPAIELNGYEAGNVSGIAIDADGVTIRGLAIARFQRNGIEILNSSSNNIIYGNYIGTDIGGTRSLGNSRGIVIVAGEGTNPNNNLIRNNVISGNSLLGIQVNGDDRVDRQGNYIVNNLIGTDYTGKKRLGNTKDENGHGIVIGQGNFTNATARYFAEYNEVRGNAIAGSHNTNLWLSNYASNNAIECNYIGTDITGTVALGNCVDGLLVGGTRANAPARLNIIRYNLISGNARCRGNTEANLTLQWGATENTIEYNLIGTDITGDRALSKMLSTDGIGIKQPANLVRNNVIGGHRRHGIHIYRGFGRQPWHNRIERNYIGINPKGTNIGNGEDGIAVLSNIDTPNRALPLTNVRIAETRVIGNAIAYNGRNGIRLEARGDKAGFTASLTNSQIRHNTIHNNQANGILLARKPTVKGAIAILKDNAIEANKIFANRTLANVPASRVCLAADSQKISVICRDRDGRFSHLR